MLDDLRMAGRFLGGLSEFLRHPLDGTACRERIARGLRDREASFLRIVDRGVFGNPRSPYTLLFRRAGIEPGDLRRLVGQEGLEVTLGHLLDAGIRISLDEFKGRRPIRRPGLEYPALASDFDNPFLARHYEASTGGSRGVGSRLVIDLDLLAHEACHDRVLLEGLDALGRPKALWRPIPPGAAGMNNALRMAKLGLAHDRWFSQQPVSLGGGQARQAAFTMLAVVASRAIGRPIARPEHVPLDRADRIAAWAASLTAEGRPAFIDTNASSGTRICLAALERGLDISGTILRLGGEPYSPGKARIVAEAGCRTAVHFAMAEVGRIGVGCTKPTALDEAHVASDKIAILQRPVPLGAGGPPVGGLFLTTLLPSTPRIMINVETGDYATRVDGDCGCPLGAIGLRTRLHTIRSYEKLTSEGMHFVGADLVEIVETLLPSRFGGRATDYQFVEEEENGLPKVSLVVSPRVGVVDESRVVSAVLEALGRGRDRAASRMMADQWHQGHTLRVVRREPHATSTSKILSLHVIGDRQRPEDT